MNMTLPPLQQLGVSHTFLPLPQMHHLHAMLPSTFKLHTYQKRWTLLVDEMSMVNWPDGAQHSPSHQHHQPSLQSLQFLISGRYLVALNKVYDLARLPNLHTCHGVFLLHGLLAVTSDVE